MHLLIVQLGQKIIKTAELKIKEFYKNDSLILWGKKNRQKQLNIVSAIQLSMLN